VLYNRFLVMPFRAMGAAIRVETAREGASPFHVEVDEGEEGGVFVLRFHRDVCREAMFLESRPRGRRLVVGVRACVWDAASGAWSRTTAHYRYLCGRDDGRWYARAIPPDCRVESVGQAARLVRRRARSA